MYQCIDMYSVCIPKVRKLTHRHILQRPSEDATAFEGIFKSELLKRMPKTRSKTNTQHTNTQLLRHFIDFEHQLSKDNQGNQGDSESTVNLQPWPEAIPGKV